MMKSALLLTILGVSSVFASPASAEMLSLACHSDAMGDYDPNIDMDTSQATVGLRAPGQSNSVPYVTGPFRASVTPLLITWNDPDRGTFSIDRTNGVMTGTWKNGGVWRFSCSKVAAPATRF